MDPAYGTVCHMISGKFETGFIYYFYKFTYLRLARVLRVLPSHSAPWNDDDLVRLTASSIAVMVF